MHEEISLRLTPLTPLWTGDKDRKCLRALETGILGSLRWWYEVLIRGLGSGHYVCDPADSTCEEKKHCHACHIFGCTGWARRFRLEVSAFEEKFAPFVIARPDGSDRPAFLGYYDNRGIGSEINGGLMGAVTLKIKPLREFNINVLKLVLRLATSWGIGARTQTGFGMVAPHNEFNSQLNLIDFELPGGMPAKNSYLLPRPRLDQFFFARISLKKDGFQNIKEKVAGHLFITNNGLSFNKPAKKWDQPYLPTAPWVRKAIRRVWHDDAAIRHYLMGFVSVKGKPGPLHVSCFKHSVIKKGEKSYCAGCKEDLSESQVIDKMGSKIYVSHVYQHPLVADRYEMKVWGWIPDLKKSENDLRYSKRREEVLVELKRMIQNEKFWKDCFGLSECPVDVSTIKWCQDLQVEDVLRQGGEILDGGDI